MARFTSELQCRYHPEAELIEDSRAGDMICSACGLVVGDRMVDVGSEWRTFSSDSDSKDRSRVGTAERLIFGFDNLETSTSKSSTTAAANEYDQQKHKDGAQQMSSTERTLRNSYRDIEQMAGNIKLPRRVIDRAYLIFQQCHEKKCVRGRCHDAVIATCIYIACRQEHSDRTMKEICAISKTTSKKEIGRCFSQVMKGLGIERPHEALEINNIIPRFCNQLEFDNDARNQIRRTAIHIANRAKEISKVQSRAPDSIAAASIYMACLAAKKEKTIKSIAETTGVVESTIKTVYKLMSSESARLFPQDSVVNSSPANLPSS